jgi:hypothetical protein
MSAATLVVERAAQEAVRRALGEAFATVFAAAVRALPAAPAAVAVHAYLRAVRAELERHEQIEAREDAAWRRRKLARRRAVQLHVVVDNTRILQLRL